MVYLALDHKVRSVDLIKIFVLSSSISKPFGANVMGSWSSRAVFIGTFSINPNEFTRVAMLFLVNVRNPLLMKV